MLVDVQANLHLHFIKTAKNKVQEKLAHGMTACLESSDNGSQCRINPCAAHTLCMSNIPFWLFVQETHTAKQV